jgi:hypothetical protein
MEYFIEENGGPDREARQQTLHRALRWLAESFDSISTFQLLLDSVAEIMWVIWRPFSTLNLIESEKNMNEKSKMKQKRGKRRQNM